MRLKPCRRRDRPQSAPSTCRLFLALAALSLSGCADEGAHQDRLRARYGPGPRSALPHGAIEAAIREGRADLEMYCDRAAALTQQAEYARAVALYQVALEKYPTSVRAHFGLGQVYAQIGKYNDAIQHWRQSAALDPEFAEAHFHLGVAYARRAPTATDKPTNLSYTDLDAAIASLSRAVELEPTNAHFHYNLGRTCELRNLSSQAAVAYRRSLDLDTGLVAAQRRLGVIYLEKGDLDRAAVSLQAAVGLDSTDAEAFYNLGRVLERRGSPARAVDAYERAIGLVPRYRQAYYNLARAYQLLGRTAASQRAQERFVALEEGEQDSLYMAQLRVQRQPEDALERRALAVAYAEAGRYGRAIEEFKKALALAPAMVGIHADLGLVYDRQGRADQAMAALEKAVALAPDSARFHLRLGQAHAKAGGDERATAAFAKALILAPGWTKAQFELAMLHVRALRPAQAVPLFEQVLKADPGHVHARFGLGLASIDLQRYPQAEAAFEQVLELQPDYPRIRPFLELVRSKQGR